MDDRPRSRPTRRYLVHGLAWLFLCASSGHALAGSETRAVAGLERPGRIVIDKWGVPHIYAQSARDAFFLQGYNAARDRLWQIDLWRKRGLGLLAKNFGPAYAEQDRAARLFLYRGDMRAEWAAYPQSAKAMTEAFVTGINAYVAATRAGRLHLPTEFGLTDTRPDLWTADDVVRIRSHTLASNAIGEMRRARVACVGGIEAAELLWKIEPKHRVRVPAGLDPCVVPDSVFNTYALAISPVAFRLPSSPRAANSTAALGTEGAEGSNNWVIAPSRTDTGRPILANDPHRALGVPSLRYVAHLEAPGLSVIGAGEPALPGISFGHNGNIAWGLTIFNVDQEDLYVYALVPSQPDVYRYGQGWERMRTVTEIIEVRGEAPRTVQLQFTRHGPVLATDAQANRAFALRTVWSASGTSGYFAGSWLLGARDWSDFKAARDNWGTPALNLIYADKGGNIGWAAAARAPIRPNWDGLLPVPGDGRYEWRGFHRGSDLPSLHNPRKGWFATANEMNLPRNYPAEQRKLSFEWMDRSRINRLDEVLGANSRMSIADSIALQVDAHNEMAGRLLRLLQPLSASEPRLNRALTLLKGWDANESVDSPAATLYQIWASFLGKATVALLAPQSARALIGAGSLDVVIGRLEKPDRGFGREAAAARDRLLLGSLAEALSFVETKLGPDVKAWPWGRLHQARFEPSVALLADPALKARMIVGPHPVPGSGSAPVALAYRADDFIVTTGASVRMAIDVGAWDNSRFINTPGQSGDPSSRFYRNLFVDWAEGRAMPLLFSKSAIDRHAAVILHLMPQ